MLTNFSLIQGHRVFEITSILSPKPAALSPDTLKRNQSLDEDDEGLFKVKEDPLKQLDKLLVPKDLNTYKVYRRFSDFEAFHLLLTNTTHCEYLLPPLPDKHIFLQNYIQQDDSAFVTQRMEDLEYYLVRLNTHHKVRYSRELREFMTGEKLD